MLPAQEVATGSVVLPGDGRTRDRVTQLLLEQGAATAAELGDALGLSPAAIRQHLDAMLADGDWSRPASAACAAPRGPRPARQGRSR